MHFRLWIENQDSENIKMAILGSLPDELKGDDKADGRLLTMRTTSFGREVLDKVKHLGIIDGLKDRNPQRYQDIMAAISSGITISDLIEKIAGKDGLGNLQSAPDKEPNLNTNPKFVPYAQSFQ